MSTSTRPGRRLPPAERRAQLVAAALELYADRPEEDVGVDDLAAAAGVTRNLVYRYFDSRAALQLAAVEEAIRRLADRMATSPHEPLSTKLPRNISMWLDSVEQGDPAVRLLLRARHSQDPAVATAALRSREGLARAIAFNHLRTRRPRRAVLAALDGYLALCERLVERWSDDGDLTRREVEAVLAAALAPVVAAVADPA